MADLPSSAAPVDPRERIMATLAATKQVPVEEMRAIPGFLPTSLRRSVAIAGAVFVPIMSLVSAYVVWLAVSRPGYFGPAWAVGLLLALAVFLTAGLVWLTGVGMSTLGIAPGDEGVMVFDRPLHRKIALRRTLRWQSLKDPSLENGRRVWLSADLIGTYLTFEQARAVLTDPRCPLRNRLPPDVSRALGLP
ncbi:MAG: transmembrane protein 268 [Thermoplasmata archaeon]|nr:transmembrane protein 268 [Thermoplasmata archaeon]MCI4357323.1 transmembrane protein 268 [Thermoplasmata archaeon]